VGEQQSPDLRIGDVERGEALRALGEHMSVGRLDADEYGERAARVTAAKTRGEITQLFVDLPEPHPQIDGHPGTLDTRRKESGAVAKRRSGKSAAASALVPLSGILAIVLFVSVDGMSWVIFMLPLAMAIIVGTLQDHRKNRAR